MTNTTNVGTGDDCVVIEDPVLAPLMENYVARRHTDAAQIRGALEAGDFSWIRIAGHNMYGSGSAYGLHGISTIGRALEQAAQSGDRAGVENALGDLTGYLARLRIVIRD